MEAEVIYLKKLIIIRHYTPNYTCLIPHRSQLQPMTPKVKILLDHYLQILLIFRIMASCLLMLIIIIHKGDDEFCQGCIVGILIIAFSSVQPLSEISKKCKQFFLTDQAVLSLVFVSPPFR